MTGTNDIDQHSNIDKLLHEIKDSLKNFTHANIILSYTPYRYDVPKLNHTIRLVNFKLKSLEDKYKNITLLSLSFLKRDHYTHHGLHLNSFDKKMLIETLIDIIDGNNQEKEIPTLITTRHENKYEGNGRPNSFFRNRYVSRKII